MTEGILSTTSKGYILNNTNSPALTAGQAVEIFLAGQWIAGRIAYQKGNTPVADNDIVIETSEESFPASDPPAWSASHDTIDDFRSTTPHNAYYFVADADNSICGLCNGMRLRTR